jgi:lipopolysaccharide/colanic/teichoic acid biosynthesis glycosyltransferase
VSKRAKAPRNIGRFLVSSSPVFWLTIESFIASLLFKFCAHFGKATNLYEIQLLNEKTALSFGIFFGLIGMGLGLFDRENRFSRLSSFQLITFNGILSCIFGVAFIYITSFNIIGRLSLFYGTAGATYGSYILVHFIGSFLLIKYPHRFAILGSSRISNFLCSEIDKKEVKQYQFATKINAEEIQDESEFILSLKKEDISEIVISSEKNATQEEAKIIFAALRQGLRIIEDHQLYAMIFKRIPLEHMTEAQTLKIGFDLYRPFSNITKRFFDIFLSSIALIILSIPFLLIAICIYLESGSPIFFTQLRYGRFGQTIKIYKFRSMTQNHNGDLANSLNDPRITRIGKLLRITHLDELPQIWNILKGEMSFVGPRPETKDIIETKDKEIPLIHLRHIVRPGLTGHAQILQGKTLDGVNELKFKLSLDVFYIKNFNLFFDLWILSRTAFKLLSSNW